MTLLLFCKQIVDMFYEFKLPDYLIVSFAAFLVIYQLWLIRPIEIKNKVQLPDICVVVFVMMLTICLIRTDAINFHMYGKIMSAFLMYFMGRVCYKRIYEGTEALAMASYIVVAVNVISRIALYGLPDFFDRSKYSDGVYYYGTDLGYAMLLSVVFIGMYAKNSIMKFITIFLICPFMILSADDGVQQVLLVVVYVILFIYMGERAVKKRAISDFILPVAIVGLLVIEAGLIAPVFMEGTDNAFVRFIDTNIVSTQNITARYGDWKIIWSQLIANGLNGLLFGIDTNYLLGNQYMSILNIFGFFGLFVFLVFIVSISVKTVKTNDRKTYYVMVLLAILFLGTCINVNGMEFTQMSWFPMMYAGLVATSSGKENCEE